jgi:limonene-1,2-epoxide hydrolase
MTQHDLHTRIRRLEDIEAVKQLKYRYCMACDDDYNPAELAPLFTEDAVWDGGAMGRFEGREAIRTFFAGASKLVPFAVHQVTNPVIEIDGDLAHGHWYLWEPIVFAQGDHALWMAGRYDDRYRRDGDRWLFEAVTDFYGLILGGQADTAIQRHMTPDFVWENPLPEPIP